jgi:hypothetical protein
MTIPVTTGPDAALAADELMNSLSAADGTGAE